MRPEDEDIARLLKKSLPSAQQEEQAGRRVYHKLFLSQSASPAAAPEKGEDGFRWESRRRFSLASAVMAAAASFLFLVVLGNSLWRIVENRGRTASSVDRVESGESVRATNPDGRMLVLPDGSLVEMRSQSEVGVDRAPDGLRVRLNAGSVIVTAAKQGAGHLYVETKDAIVSVVGTVFVVSSEQTGSRVGVIEGIVNVQHGANSQKLLPGQQLSTNPAMQPVPLDVQVSWSRSVASLLALLQPSVPLAPRPAAAPAAPLQNTQAAPSNSQPPGSLLIIGTSSNSTASQVGQRNAFGNNRGGPGPDNSRQTPPVTAESERALEEALRSREPITDLPMLIETSYFKINRAESFVPVTLKLAGSQLTGSENSKRIFLDVLGEFRDDFGNVVQNFREAVDVRLSDETAKGLQARQIVYDTGVTLLPGRYSTKFLIRDGVTGKVGTYQAALMIPNLNKENQDLPISSVVLSNELIDPKDALPNSLQPRSFSLDNQLARDPLFIEGKKLIPSVSRTFSKRRALIAFLQAYEPNADVTTPLTAFVTLYRGQTKVFETAPVTVKDDLKGRKVRTLPARLDVPLSTVPVGSYDCQVTIVDSVTQKSAVWRSPINVVN